MRYSPWGRKESDTTEVTKRAHTCADLGIDHFVTFSKDSLEGPYYLSCCEGRKRGKGLCLSLEKGMKNREANQVVVAVTEIRQL